MPNQVEGSLAATYLDLLLVHILGLEEVSEGWRRARVARQVTYQIAHDDLAVTGVGGRLGGGGLVGRCARVLRCLLNTADRRSSSGTAAVAGGLALAATAGAGRATTGRQDVVERLIELSRHVDGDD